MDQICPRCGCRSFHYNRSRMRVECDACGHALTDPQELQLQRQDDRNFQQACEHLRAGNWQQAAGLLPLMERRPVDRRLYLAALSRRDEGLSGSRGARAAAHDGDRRMGQACASRRSER